jgi:Fe-S cluster biogenesis protein NfuA
MATAEETRKKVEEELEKIKPRLQADGGDVRLVSVEDGVVTVELEGACKGCPMSAVTLAMGIERTIKAAVPEVKKVEAANATFPPGLLDKFRGLGN